jgi:hypothetical protein
LRGIDSDLQFMRQAFVSLCSTPEVAAQYKAALAAEGIDEKVRLAFAAAADGAPSISDADGLLAALRPLGVCMAQRSFAEVLKVYDSDGSVSIGVEEFAALVRKEAAFAAARKECNTCPTADQTRNLHSPASCA